MPDIIQLRGREIKLGSAEGLKGKVREISKNLEKIRTPGTQGVNSLADDLSLRDHLALTYQTSPEHLYQALGIDPRTATVEFLLTVDDDTRWLVPELFRDAIRLGLLRDPVYPNLIAASEPIAQPSLIMPYFNVSDAEPDDLSEGQTIGVGTVTYGSKSVTIQKQGIGIDLTYESIQYTNINLLSLFLQDMGAKLGRKLDKAAIAVLVNGDQADGSQSTGTKGVAVDNTLDYASVLKVWIRLGLLGRTSGLMLANEAMANTLLALAEFKNKEAGTPQKGLQVKSPIPQTQDLYIANPGSVLTDDDLMFVDPRFALVQLTSAPLTVESEKIIQRQIQSSMATITTGFANVFRDARIMLQKDETTDFSSFLTPAS